MDRIELHDNGMTETRGRRSIKLTENGIEVYWDGKKIVELTKDGMVIVESGVTVCGYSPENPDDAEALRFAILAMQYGEVAE